MSWQKVTSLNSNLRRTLAWLLIIGVLASCSAKDDSGQKQAEALPIEHVQSSDTRLGIPATEESPRKVRESAKSSQSARSSQVKRHSGEPSLRDGPYDLLETLQELAWGESDFREEDLSELFDLMHQQGADMLLPIRDFLLESRGSVYVPPGMREFLLDVLLSLDLPEVGQVALELLSTGVSANEVARLGAYLESTEPGKYSDQIRLAAEQALVNADPTQVLPGEFFQMLGMLGNEQTADLLAAMPWRHGAYARIALASLPDGAGLAALEREAHSFEAGSRVPMQGRLTIQLLAQMAPQYPEAAATLIELAEQGVIPNEDWGHVLDILAGRMELTLLKPSPEFLVDSHTFFGREGNQIIYWAAMPHDTAGVGLQEQRLYLLDQLKPFIPVDLAASGGGP